MIWLDIIYHQEVEFLETGGNPNIIQNWSKIGHCEQGNQVGSGCALFWFILRVPKCSETSAWRSGNLGIQRDPNCAQRMLFFRICVGTCETPGVSWAGHTQEGDPIVPSRFQPNSSKSARKSWKTMENSSFPTKLASLFRPGKPLGPPHLSEGHRIGLAHHFQ